MSTSARSSNYDSYRSDRDRSQRSDDYSHRKRDHSPPMKDARDSYRRRSRSRSRSRERDDRKSVRDSHHTTDANRSNNRYEKHDRPSNPSSYRRDDRGSDRHNSNNRFSGRGHHHGRNRRDSNGPDIPENEIVVESSLQRPKFDWSTALLPSGKLEDGEEYEASKKRKIDDDEVYDENMMKDLEKFIERVGGIDEDDNNDEDEKASVHESIDSMDEEERLIEERRKRRDEIMKKYQATSSTLTQSLDAMDVASVTNASITTDEKSMESTTNAAIEDGNEDEDDEYDVIPLFNRMRSSSTTDTIIEANPDTEMDIYNDHAAQLEAERKAVEAEATNQRGQVFDMFSSSPSDLQANPIMNGRTNPQSALHEGENRHLQSNWDDSEGYYKARIGEVIADRYRTLGIVGKGVFSTVLKCLDLTSRSSNMDDDHPAESVAIKFIRNNDVMKKAAEKERMILHAILNRDPENKKHCVKLYTTFEYRNHIAFVFEYQAMNLREALKKFGKDVGINVGAIRLYGKQLFIALKLLSDLQIVHADIKLDNILCSEDLRQVKLCDFGSGFRLDDPENIPTPYLVSRFYRAPEIMLGLQYDIAIDLWSVCVSLYELFTGHVMFPGRTNNDMIRLIMQVKGRFSNKVIKSHLRSYETLQQEPHFEADMRFKQYENDPVTGKVILKLVDIAHPVKDLNTILRSNKAGADDTRLVNHFADLLERGLTLEPSKRMTVAEALKHPFFVAKL